MLGILLFLTKCSPRTFTMPFSGLLRWNSTHEFFPTNSWPEKKISRLKKRYHIEGAQVGGVGSGRTSFPRTSPSIDEGIWFLQFSYGGDPFLPFSPEWYNLRGREKTQLSPMTTFLPSSFHLETQRASPPPPLPLPPPWGDNNLTSSPALRKGKDFSL